MFASPNIGFVLATAGVMAIYGEFVWPGKVWPASVGSLSLVAGAYILSRFSPSSEGLALLALSALLFLCESAFGTHLLFGIAGAIAFAAGSSLLFSGPPRIQRGLALVLSVALGATTVFLANAAKRARRNKRADVDL